MGADVKGDKYAIIRLSENDLDVIEALSHVRGRSTLDIVESIVTEHLNETRDYLRICTHCGKRYLQKSVKRNPNEQYFCSSVDRSSKCKQEYHDGQKHPNRMKRVPAIEWVLT